MSMTIVKAKGWQIFFVFVAGMVFYAAVPPEQESLKMIAAMLFEVIIIGWFLILGTALNENLPETEQMSPVLFTISCLYVILVTSLSSLLKDALGENSVTYLIAVISFVISFFYMIYFTSTLYAVNQEKYLEKDKLRHEVIFILFIGFIFGVLIFQSRVRKCFR